MSLSPAFDGAVTTYAVNTPNNSNKVTATPTDPNADVEISLGVTPIENGTAATWEAGENIVTVKVTNKGKSTTYTITVTKE